MSELPANNDAWRRAGADAKAPASGEQIEHDVAAQPGSTAPASPAGREDRGRSASDDEPDSPDVASGGDPVDGAKPKTP